MIPTTPPDHKVHEGRNIKRFREMLQIKQEALAIDLGDDWTQKKVSLLEAKETIEPALLKRVADILKLPVEALQNFEEENAINVIANTFNCTDFKDNAAVVNVQPTFDAAESILKLHEEKMALYERMLKEKDELMATLKGVVGEEVKWQKNCTIMSRNSVAAFVFMITFAQKYFLFIYKLKYFYNHQLITFTFTAISCINY